MIDHLKSHVSCQEYTVYWEIFVSLYFHKLISQILLSHKIEFRESIAMPYLLFCHVDHLRKYSS